MTRDVPHILILDIIDEPPNHLDIDFPPGAVAALNVFDGAVILITHDT